MEKSTMEKSTMEKSTMEKSTMEKSTMEKCTNLIESCQIKDFIDSTCKLIKEHKYDHGESVDSGRINCGDNEILFYATVSEKGNTTLQLKIIHDDASADSDCIFNSCGYFDDHGNHKNGYVRFRETDYGMTTKNAVYGEVINLVFSMKASGIDVSNLEKALEETVNQPVQNNTTTNNTSTVINQSIYVNPNDLAAFFAQQAAQQNQQIPNPTQPQAIDAQPEPLFLESTAEGGNDDEPFNDSINRQ